MAAGKTLRSRRGTVYPPSRIGRIREYMSDTVWDIETSDLSVRRRFGINFVRVLSLVFKGFHDDECPLHASALTFSTLMSIVPVLALSLFIARGFGAGDVLQQKILGFVESRLYQLEHASLLHREAQATVAEGEPASAAPAPSAPAPAVSPLVDAAQVFAGGEPDAPVPVEDIVTRVKHLLETLFSYVNNVNFAALGSVGLALLIWSVINTLGEVEAAFNRVWGVTVSRSFPRKLSDYLGVVVLTPVLLLMCSSIPVIDLIQGYLHAYLPEVISGFLSNLLDARILKHITVLALVSLSFSLFIMIMPNARVRFGPAVVGGVVAALLFVIWLWVCVQLEVGAVRAGKVYGSFAIVPIVLLWVLISWQITLFGAEVAFAVQNCGTFRMEQPARRASMESRIVLAVNIVAHAARGLQAGNGAFDAAAFARERNVPVRLLNEVLHELVDEGILAEVADRANTFVLIKSPELVQVGDLVTAMLKSGIDPDALGLARPAGDLEAALRDVRSTAVALFQPPPVKDAAPPGSKHA